VLGGDPVNATGGGWIGETERPRTETHVDRWVGTLLGPPANIRIPVRLAAPTVANPDATQEVTLTLDALALRPLDFIALVPPAAAATGDVITLEPHDDGSLAKASELEGRIAAAALAGNPHGGPIEIRFGRQPGTAADVLSLGEALEIGRAIKSVLAKARPLQPRDLVTPEYAKAPPGADAMTGEADARASDLAFRLAAAG